jgi:1-aminocyclopropane-1-carboxylate deaminase
MFAPIQRINDPLLAHSGVDLFIKREDLIHPHISGNKFRKLKYNIQEAKTRGYSTILTMGGAFSNHIAASAFAAREEGFNSIGIIRGEQYEALNPTLSFAKECGMHLHYVNRHEYRNRHHHEFIKNLHELFDSFYLIPEGGANEEGAAGCAEILEDIAPGIYDYICCACGTGTTLAGMLRAYNSKKTQFIGFAVLKARKSLEDTIRNLSGNSEVPWTLNTEYHLGGYAKFPDSLKTFINSFERQTNIPLDPVYTGKMLYGVYDMISNSFFRKGQRILLIHTGGLQGKKGFIYMAEKKRKKTLI